MILHHKLEDVRRILNDFCDDELNRSGGPVKYHTDCGMEKLVDDILEAIFGCGYGKIEEALRGAEPPVHWYSRFLKRSRVCSRRSSG
jgi:hypothetical protein